MASKPDRDDAFHEEMLKVYRDARDLAGYRATRFLQLVRRRGGVEAARHLLKARSKVSGGFEALWKAGRLDLSVEALVLRERYSMLFDERELRTARERLAKHGQHMPGS